MYIYLPIAEMSVNIFLVLGMGAGVGVMSGIFGVGGGFLMTPLLIFLGVPAPVAVGTGANQIIASSVSGVLAHWRRGNVDLMMGLMLLSGGVVGSTLGVFVFKFLQTLGQIDLVIKLSYVIFLGIIGALMMAESLRSLLRSHRKTSGRMQRKLHQHNWMHGLPLKFRFRKSKLYISLLLPIGIGFLVGILTAIMGVGGGFVMVPAMIYLLGMPTNVVVGTSLFQIIFVSANATFLQATLNQTVDVVLAMLLLVGGVIGAQIGTKLGAKLKGEQLRSLLAIMVLLVSGKLLFDLVITPDDLYSIVTVGEKAGLP
ncbi:MAG: sulfite exporter TauE/SafE family protein [Alphaproteobacteria bacterium]|nr:sulfite exporter TauE/SafE family protein [Alphaproteobacteria bacterium]